MSECSGLLPGTDELGTNRRCTTDCIPFRQIACALLFGIFLIPYTTSSGISANYSFVLFPPLWVLCTHRLARPTIWIQSAFLLYVLIFGLTAIFQSEQVEFQRRAASFVVFIAMFSYTIVRCTDAMAWSFRAAVVGVSTIKSGISITQYHMLGGASLGASAKDLVGTQRYGFVYLLAFWIVLYWKPKSSARHLLRLLSLFIIAGGLFLTFSRASVVAFMLSLFLFLVMEPAVHLWRRQGRVSTQALRHAFCLGIIGCLIALFLGLTATGVISFFNDRLVHHAIDASSVQADVSNVHSSSGARLYIWGRILEYVAQRPFFGSGFLGVWILGDDDFGSAHNQYMDVLFRTGVLGLLVYLALLTGVCHRLYCMDKGLFYGLCGILAYGVFHETFKESQGGFILAFLLSYALKDAHLQAFGVRCLRP